MPNHLTANRNLGREIRKLIRGSRPGAILKTRELCKRFNQEDLRRDITPRRLGYILRGQGLIRTGDGIWQVVK